MDKITVIAHRSGPVNHPEQTIAAAREALSLGADYIEIDTRLTSDGEVAISHDANLGRVYDTDKTVGELSGKEIRELRHGHAPEYTAHLFLDYLEAGIAPLLLHIKETQTIPPLVRMIEEWGYSDKVVLGITKPEEVHLVRELNPSLKMLSFAQIKHIDEMIALGVDYIRLWEPWLADADLVTKVKSSQSRLWVMSGECEGRPVGEVTPEAVEKILSYKPDGILVNDVRYLTYACHP